MKRWQFLLVSILVTALVLGGAVLLDGRQDKVRRLEIERDYQKKRIADIHQQLDEAADRLADLEEMLLHLQRMEQIVSRSAAPSRGGRRQLTLTTMPLDTPSGYSAARFEMALKGTSLAGIGEALVQAEAETGINGLILAGICAHESGWGTSRLAQEKNNLAGLGAYDHSPGSAIRFENREECVMFLAELLRDRPGESLEEIGWWYASDKNWAKKVAGCMKLIVGRT